MAPNTRAFGDPASDTAFEALSRRVEAQEQLVSFMHASLLSLHVKIDSLQASAAVVSAASGSSSPTNCNSLLGTRTPPIPSGTNPPPILGRSSLSLDISSFFGVDPLVGVDGSTLHWAQWLRQSYLCLSWPKLKREMIQRFDTRYSGSSAIERLCGVRQTIDLVDYIDEFVALVSHCSVKEFHAIIGDVDPEVILADFEALELSVEDTPLDPTVATFHHLDLSCASEGGISGQQTMQLSSTLRDHPIIIMAQKAEREATDLKGSMRKRMEFLDLD
ncbi:hypothetical protein KSP39_PZI016848 [Platanthera zijinensis]|uniref:Retrotransposon gag domain-containing protein n=1 Tax=Platanthera zijinensis TaxID=2320716 RepID=A0AAP0B8D1_9ASPA